MRRVLIAPLVALGIMACASLIPAPPVPVPGVIVIEAQSLPYTLPYTLTVAWNAPVDGTAITYTCYLDGVAVISGVNRIDMSDARNNARATYGRGDIKQPGVHTVRERAGYINIQAATAGRTGKHQGKVT